MRDDDLFEKDECLRRSNRDESREVRWQLHPCESLFARARITNGDRQIESEVGDVWERMSRVNGEGGENRIDAFHELARELDSIALRQLIPPREEDAVFCKFRKQRISNDRLLGQCQ